MKSFTLEPRDTGSVIHDILARYTTMLRQQEAPVLSEWLPKELAVFPPEQAEALLPNLLAFFDRNTGDILKANAVEVEVKLGMKLVDGDFVPCDFDDPECWLHGIADRIDTHDLGIRVITDYKTGWSGHDRLQGVVYGILLLVLDPNASVVQVQFANPVSDYLSEPFPVSRDECIGQAEQLLETMKLIRAKGYTGALSYSSLKKFYQCPAWFWYSKSPIGVEPSDHTTGKHCGMCRYSLTCPKLAQELTCPSDVATAQVMLTRCQALLAVADSYKALLKYYCEENETEVKAGGITCGLVASAPRPKVKLRELAKFLLEQPEVDVDKVLSLKDTKASSWALADFASAGGEVKLLNAPVRFLFASEAKEE